MTKGSGKARLRRARFALSSLPQRSSGLFSDLICRAGKTPDGGESAAAITPTGSTGAAPETSTAVAARRAALG